MTDDDLEQIEKRAAEATPGPWYPHRTDDQVHSNARYVSVEPSDFAHDNKTRMWAGSRQQANPEGVIAITLLQSPGLAVADACDENTLFIAHARTDVPSLVSEVRRLRERVAELEKKMGAAQI
jgi:hypothetical protein